MKSGIGFIGSWRRQMLPVAVWLSAIGASGWLFTQRGATYDLTGIANPQQRQIAALTDGRLRLVPVELFDTVKEGQPLAVLEDCRIQTLLATATAETARLQAELVAAESQWAADHAAQESNYLTEARRYAIDTEQSRLAEIELQVTLETDRVRLEFLRMQRDVLSNLRGQRAVSDLRFKTADNECKVIEQQVEQNQKMLLELRETAQQARQRQEEFSRTHITPPSLDTALAPLRAAVAVQERKVGELALERSMLVLKSPIDGVVAQLLRGAGELVRIGEPILVVASTRPSEVIAYVNSSQFSQLQPGTPVRLQVARTGAIMTTISSQVQAVGPTAEQVPMRLWHSPTVPEWGWPVKIAIPPQLDILSGEVIGVSGDLAVSNPVFGEAKFPPTGTVQEPL